MLFQSVRLLGAVGIENNTDQNLKDLEEMPGNAKALMRNNSECKVLRIGPLKALVFLGAGDSVVVFFLVALKAMSASGQISRH